MDAPAAPAPRRRRLLVKFTCVALVGFTVSAAVLHLGLEAGLRPWSARLIALGVAMNVTFLVNSRFVFEAPQGRSFFACWAAYLANSAFGNTCSYWVFVTLESLHRPVISNPYVALLAGSIAAWAINFTGARFLVFGGAARRLAARCRRAWVSRPSRPCAPVPAEPGSSPP